MNNYFPIGIYIPYIYGYIKNYNKLMCIKYGI